MKQLRDFLNEGIITLEVYITKILNIYKFEPKKKYIEELEDTGESDATSIAEDTDEEDDEHHTEDEEDDAIKNDEILRVEEILQEEVVAVAVVNDNKVACDVCGIRFTSRGLNRHKYVHNKNRRGDYKYRFF